MIKRKGQNATTKQHCLLKNDNFVQYKAYLCRMNCSIPWKYKFVHGPYKIVQYLVLVMRPLCPPKKETETQKNEPIDTGPPGDYADCICKQWFCFTLRKIYVQVYWNLSCRVKLSNLAGLASCKQGSISWSIPNLSTESARPQRLINIWFKTADVAIGRKHSSRFALSNLAYKTKQKAIQQKQCI